MADSSPDRRPDHRGTTPTMPRRPGSSSPSETSSPIVPGPSLSRASVPPSEPRSTSRGSFSQLDSGGVDRPARLQMIVALMVGLVLVAIPLYLWRRPRADAVAVSGSSDGGAEPRLAGLAPTVPPEEKPTVGDMKNLLCQDPGPKKTPPEQCDHVVDVEKAFAKAIEETASCMPKDAGGGTLIYVADVSFKRKALNVAIPKEGRAVKNLTAISACQTAVKSRLQGLALDAITHAHARYKISVTATYPGVAK
jgi:hypothetical protein